MSVILVIRPDPSQAKILNDVARCIGTEVLIVDSTVRAVEAIGRQIPDLILLSAFLSPRDEDTLMACLRSLEGTSHLQTLSIPQFRSTDGSTQKKKSGFGFRKKQKAPVSVGADPAAFAEEVAGLLQRASEIRSRPASAERIRTVIVHEVGASETVAQEPFVPDHVVEELSVEMRDVVESLVAEPAVEPALSMAAEIHELVRRLGIDVNLDGDTDEAPDPLTARDVDDTHVFDFGASLDQARNEGNLQRSLEVPLPQIDIDAIRETAMAEARAVADGEAREARAAEMAGVQAEAAMLREVAIAEARVVAERVAAIAEARTVAEREAREALAADLQRVQVEAEQMRETAIAEARVTAAREARDTLAVEVARVRSEAESTFTDALNKVKTEAGEAERRRIEAERVNAERLNAEAQQAFARELARVRAEVEESLAVQLGAAREEAERIRVAEAHAVHERAAVEAQLKADLDRLRFVAAQTRRADESETRKAAEQIKQLEAELAIVRTKTEARKGDELQELRAQMAELREAAARHARIAAAEAVAAEVARATARPPAAVAQFPARAFSQTDPPDEAPTRSDSRDYLSLWQPKPPERVAAEDPPNFEEPAASLVASIDVRRHAKWAVPIAACLLLVTNTGTAISTVARFVKTDQKPALIVQPVKSVPFIEVVEQRVGTLKVESTPGGADAIVDGRRYGKTPVTIPDLEVGAHTLVLKSAAGTITRRITIKNNQTTLLTEAIFSGWLAIFSPISIAVVIDGKPINLTDDGRLMTTPGKHVVELFSERFNYRSTQTLDVRPGETTAHTLTLPMGRVRVTAPEGSEIKVDGAPAGGTAAEELSVAIGSHEISATHPSLGERRASVDVRHGDVTVVTLQFEQ